MLLLKRFFSLFLEVLFPPLCLSCGRYPRTPPERKVFLCNSCQERVRLDKILFCANCNRSLPFLVDCCGKNFPIFAVASYKNKVVRGLIHALKYRRLRSAMIPLGELVIKPYLGGVSEAQEVLRRALIVPIPLHRRRERRRGFNQALLIAEALGEEVNEIIEKIKSVPAQVEAEDFEERSRNVAGSFRVMREDLVKGREIILVDDVFTSGATIKEVARVLAEAGATKTYAFVVAKA